MLVIQLVLTHKRHFLFCHLQTALLTLFYTAYFCCKQTFFISFELIMRNKILFYKFSVLLLSLLWCLRPIRSCYKRLLLCQWCCRKSLKFVTSSATARASVSKPKHLGLNTASQKSFMSFSTPISSESIGIA